MIRLCVLVSCLAACGDNLTAGSCDDGLRNGGETDVDCGGGCWAGCAIGAACTTHADCVFAACTNGTCAAPTAGPTPTGAITATIDPSGAIIDYVSDEHVAVHLEVPPGAVIEPIEITIEPNLPGRGQWLASRVSPGGVILRVPATLTVTLPPGVDPGAGFLGAFDDVGLPTYVQPTTDDSGARTLVATLSFLGDPSSHPTPELAREPLTSAVDHWAAFFALASQLPPEQILPLLQQLADSVLHEGRFEDAAALVRGIKAMRERSLSTANAAALAAFIEANRVESCSRLTAQLVSLDESTPRCAWQLQTYTEPVAASWALVEALGGGTDVNACPNTSDWHDRIGTKMNFTIDVMQHHRVDWQECECARPLRPGEHRSEACNLVQHPIVGPFAAPAVMVDGWELQLFTAAVDRDRNTFDSLYALDLAAYAPPLAIGFTDAEVNVVRELAYASCLNDQDMSYLDVLARFANDPAAILTDAQHCASTLNVTTVDGAMVTQSTTSATPGSTIGSSIVEVTAVALPGTTLQVRGPVATLVCRDMIAGPTRREADVLTLFAESGTQHNSLGTLQANGSANVMPDNLGFNVDADLTRTSLGRANDAPFDLVLERSGPGCGIQQTATLFRIHVSNREDRLVVLQQSAADPYTVWKIEPGATTMVFDVAVPASAGSLWYAINVYLRHQHAAVLAVNDPNDAGHGFNVTWGILDAAGALTVTEPIVQNQNNAPYAVSSNGKYREQTLDPDTNVGGGFVDLIYDNATGLVVDQVTSPDGIAIPVVAVGPAGEMLYIENNPGMGTSIWYFHAFGVATDVSLGPVGSGGTHGAIGVRGDKIYLEATSASQTAIVEIDRATLTPTTLPGLAVPRGDWTIEPGAIIYLDRTNGVLKRYDLTTAAITSVGTLPASPNIYLVR